MNRILPFIITFLLVLLDQIVKIICVTKLKIVGSIQIVEDFFYFTYVENRGAAFGTMQGARWIFIIIAVVAAILCIYYYKKLSNTKFLKFKRFSLILIASGAIGNMIDRAFRGYVVDMIHFIFGGKDFAVFNIADIYICVGTFLIAIFIIFSESKDKL